MVVPLETLEGKEKIRTGILEGKMRVPEDFDRIGEEEIRTLFGEGL